MTHWLTWWILGSLCTSPTTYLQHKDEVQLPGKVKRSTHPVQLHLYRLARGRCWYVRNQANPLFVPTHLLDQSQHTPGALQRLQGQRQRGQMISRESTRERTQRCRNMHREEVAACWGGISVYRSLIQSQIIGPYFSSHLLSSDPTINYLISTFCFVTFCPLQDSFPVSSVF